VLFSSAVYATPYSGWMLWLAVSGVLNCALSLYSYARVIRFMGIEEEKTAKLPVPMLLSSRSPSLESSRPGSSPGPSSPPRRRRGGRSCRGEGRIDENADGRFVAVALSIFLLSLAGIPFFGGFFSKFVLFSSAAYATQYNGWMLWLAVSGVLNRALSLYY